MTNVVAGLLTQVSTPHSPVTPLPSCVLCFVAFVLASFTSGQDMTYPPLLPQVALEVKVTVTVAEVLAAATTSTSLRNGSTHSSNPPHKMITPQICYWQPICTRST